MSLSTGQDQGRVWQEWQGSDPTAILFCGEGIASWYYISIDIYILYTCLYNLDLIFTSSWGISIICTYMGISLVSDIILYFVELPSATEITSAHLQTDNKANLWQCPGEVSHTGVLKPWIPSRHRGLTYTKSWSNDLDDLVIFFEPSIYSKFFFFPEITPHEIFMGAKHTGSETKLVASNLFIFHGYPERRWCRKTDGSHD